MGQDVTYPDGSTLVSSALTIQQIQGVMQNAVCQMLGIAEPETSPLVRIAYGVQGNIFSDSPTDDVCFIRLMPKDDPYNRIRDKFNWGPAGWGDALYGTEPYGGVLDGDPALTEQTTYTNVWNIHFTLYGANSYDRARMIRSAFYQDYFTNLLKQSQLFPVPDFSAPVRVPEEIGGQWFERVDMDFEMYEFVTEMKPQQTVIAVEVVVEDSEGVIADLKIAAPGYGAGPWGQQPFGT